MLKPPVHDLPANYVGMKPRQASGDVELQFLASGSGQWRVTIPLHDLVRLVRESERKGVQAKYEAYLASKKAE